jgi:hypothetical protein
MIRANLFRVFCVVGMALVAAAPVVAQNNPYSPSPYYSPPYSGYAPDAGGPLAADVIRATGQLGIQQEQARLAREWANQAGIQTQRMAFDEAIYEKANTPSYLDEQDHWTQTRIQHAMNQPGESEIRNGDTLNLLLPYLKALAEDGTPGPLVSLDPATVKAINVRVGITGPAIGMLKDAGHINWPLFLRGPTQQAFDRTLPDMLQQATAGTLAPATYTQALGMVHAMQGELLTRFFRENIGSDAYLADKTFLDALESSLTVLERPDAGQLLDGSHAAHGNNLQELVNSMTAQGLQFAPATHGSESAYFALHNAFVSYARAAESTGFHAMISPPSAS